MNRRTASAVGLLLVLAAPFAVAPAWPQERNSERNVYFGETHVHTSWSFDAYVFGNTKAGPEDAYKFAMGRPYRPSGRLQSEDHPAARFHGGD